MTAARLRAGIAGLGQVGLLFDGDSRRTGVWTHFSAYEQLSERYELVAACDPDPERRRLAGDRNPRVRCYETLEQMLDAEPLDVVSLCTPPSVHLDQIRTCAGRVRAVICEKPLGGGRYAASREAVDRCAAAGTLLAVNYYKRYDGCVPCVAQRLREAAIGQVRAATAIYAGPLEAVGCHAIDLLAFLLGPLSLVHAVRTADDRRAVILRFGTDGVASLQEVGPREELVFEVDLLGSTGRLRLLENCTRLEECRFATSTHYDGYRELVALPSRGDCGGVRFVPLFVELADALAGRGTQLTSDGASALETERLLEQIGAVGVA